MKPLRITTQKGKEKQVIVLYHPSLCKLCGNNPAGKSFPHREREKALRDQLPQPFTAGQEGPTSVSPQAEMGKAEMHRDG